MWMEVAIARALKWADDRKWMAAEFARQLAAHTGEPITSHRIWNWKKRGLPSRMHRPVAELFGRSVEELTASGEPAPPPPALTYSGKPQPTSGNSPATIEDEPETGSGSVTIAGSGLQAMGAKGGDVVINQFDARGSMGGGLVLDGDQPGVIRSWTVSRDWLTLNVKRITSAKNLCVVTGFGDSMRPTYNPGDPLLVDIGVTSVEHDGIYFFRVGNHGFIKRLQTIPHQGIRVISDNKEKGYETWTITPDMDLQVFGKVVRLWRGDEF